MSMMLNSAERTALYLQELALEGPRGTIVGTSAHIEYILFRSLQAKKCRVTEKTRLDELIKLALQKSIIDEIFSAALYVLKDLRNLLTHNAILVLEDNEQHRQFKELHQKLAHTIDDLEGYKLFRDRNRFMVDHLRKRSKVWDQTESIDYFFRVAYLAVAIGFTQFPSGIPATLQ